MRVNGWLPFGLVAVLLQARCEAPQPPPGPGDAVKARVTSLIQQIDSIVDTTDDVTLEQAEFARLTEQIHHQIDRYIESTFPPLDTSAKLQDRLRAALDTFASRRELADPPMAHVKDASSGRSLVVTYSVRLRGDSYPHTSSIRGYRETAAGTFELVATTGDAFENQTMFTTELTSPTVGEIWLLVHGESPTANGLRGVTFRIYAFDGHEFRAVWSPRAMSGAELRMTDDGFVIDHVLRDVEPWQPVEDYYVLTLDGARQITRLTRP